MEASLRKIKVSAYNRKLQLKKRKQARRLRATKGLDRPPFIRLRSLHPVRFQVIKVKNGRITSRSLRVAGAAGTQWVTRVRRLCQNSLHPISSGMSQKYRLKLDSLTQYQIQPSAFKIRPAHRLRHGRQSAARRVDTSLRRRTFLSNLLFSRRHALQLRTAHAPRLPATSRPLRRWQKRWGLRYHRRAALHRYDHLGFRERRKPAVMPNKALRRVTALRYHATRLDFHGFNLFYQRRWWWNKKLRKGRGKERKRLKAEGKRKGTDMRRKRSRWLRRRRNRGRRLFAGIFGPRRWRAERRDRFFLRRGRREETVRRLTVYSTVRHAGSRALARAESLQQLHVAISSLPQAMYPLSATPFGQRTRLQYGRHLLNTVRKRSKVNRRERALHEVIRTFQPMQARRLRSKLSTVFSDDISSESAIKKVSLTRRARLLSRKLRPVPRKYRCTLRMNVAPQQTTLRLRKLLLQRRLHGSILTAPLQYISTPLKPGRAVARTRKHLLAPHVRLLGGGVSTPIRPVEYDTNLKALPSSQTAHPLPLKRTLARAHGSDLRYFLQKRLDRVLRGRSHTPQTTSLGSTLVAIRQRRRYQELRFYHKRPRIRLPRIAVTRCRRRKGGLVTFVRKSLKRPRTLLGRQNLLLPPATTYAAVASTYLAGGTPTSRRVFAAAESPEDEWPLFWRRRHTRANIKAISAVRRRQYSRRKRRYTLQQKRWILRAGQTLQSPHELRNVFSKVAKSKGLCVFSQAIDTHRVIAAAVRDRLVWRSDKDSNSKGGVLRFLRRKRRKQAQRTYSPLLNPIDACRTMRHPTPAISRIAERTLLMSQKRAAGSQRLLGLWQARSVQSMLVAERAMSAWSPQLSVRNRRAHFPRVQGVPVRRRTLSFTAKRRRRNFNAKLLARNIPQRRYTDYAPIKLQYYYGSIGSAGYVRFRRVHRPHSKHSRWWRPNKFAVPFAHPFTRRALNAKRYSRSGFSVARTPQYKTFTRLMRDRRAAFLHSKVPPRTIPWRNFRFARPRRGRTPKTLQRWTFVKRNGRSGQVRPNKSRLVLARSAREIRALEHYTFTRGLWKGRRWNLLDRVALTGSAESHLFSALRSIPRTIWLTLQRRSGSAAAYSVLQRRILDEFRRWARKAQRVNSQLAAVTVQQAQLFLIHLLAAMLRMSSKQISSIVHETQRHATLRANSFSRKVDLKAINFLQLRALPHLDRAPQAVTILQRERSGLYRRWLQGVEGAVKRSQLGYIPTSRSRYTANVAVMFGRRRARFPASGRRRKSYDSLLHAFAKKVGPARLRRASVTQFKRALPRIVFDFRENLLTTIVSATLDRRRVWARKLSKAGYLSAPWRELLQYGGLRRPAVPLADSAGAGAKRRFLSLPLAAIVANRAQYTLRATPPYKQQMRVIRAGILRRALRRRREERPFVDLRHSAIHRRLPKEQASRPWKLRRAVKRWRAAKVGPYSNFTVRRRAAIPSQWTLVHLSAVGPQQEYMELSPLRGVLISGERIAPVDDMLCKDKRAFRGIVLPVNTPPRRKLRRKVRGTANRSRVSRRPNPAGRYAVIRNTRHWSEKRDQDFRTATLRHKRFSYAKRVSRALKDKFRSRHGAAAIALQAAKKVNGARLARFVSSRHFAVVGKKQGPANNRPVANMLVQSSSFTRRRRLTTASQLKIARLRQRSYRAPRRKERFYNAKFNFQTMQRGSTLSARLVSVLNTEASVAALWFQKLATRVVKSEKAKENDALANIAEKEGRYKITAQYVESLTAFIPELMNHMLSKKIERDGQRIRYKTAQHLVRNIYWSLRVYLNVDPFDIRFFVRDKRAAARVHLFECISDLSEFQVTEQPQRAALRYRFQPSKVLRAPNTMRFRGDWLRAFFPAKHALYQENPIDYRKFLLKTRLIRRLRIGPRGIASWATQQQPISHETRARQILALRFSRKRRRFETVLQTTRRSPEPEGISSLAARAPRNHFFSRLFSTYTGRGLAPAARWIHRQKRFIALEEGWRVIPPVAQVIARNRTISHLESRGRGNYVGTDRAAISNTFLDLRFIRAKSARSRQYLIRLTKALCKLNKEKKFTNLVFYRKLLDRRLAAAVPAKGCWTRLRRRRLAVALRPSWAARGRSPLQKVRAAYLPRRMSTVCILRHTRAAHRERSPKMRTSALTHQTAVVLPREAIFSLGLFRRYRERERKWCSSRRRLRRFIRLFLRARKKRVLARKRSRRAQKLKRKRRSSKKLSYQVKKTKIKRSYSQELWYQAQKVKRKRLRQVQKIKRKRLYQAQKRKWYFARRKLRFTRISLLSNNKPALPRKLLRRFRFSSAAVRPARATPRNCQGRTRFFKKEVSRGLFRALDFARACALHTRFYRQAPFEAHRPRLWDALTERWMKKHRIGRYWLRDTARWLRDPWLSEIVACDASLRPDRFGGELRSRPQQVGEYVAEVDDQGRDIKRKDAPKERHKLQKILPIVNDPEIKKTNKILKKGSRLDRSLARQRLRISRLAFRKPMPGIRLANYEFRDIIREHKANKAKSAKQKKEEEELRVKAYWARKAKKLPPERPKRLPLKHPANLWLPHIIWKEIQRRIRKFEWRESDEVFFRRGFRRAFQFYPNERRKAPWLEYLMYTRATYSTRLREFRRRQYPHEQKKFKWLQRVRRMLYPGRNAWYIKGRRWPQLRRYNQKLHYSLFNLRDRSAARRHFKKLNGRTRPSVSGFVSMSKGLTDRLDLTCLQLGFAPSIYWARIVTEFGLLRVNGTTVYDPTYQIKPDDIIYPNWDTVARFQHYFKPQLRAREEYLRRNRVSTSFHPTNMEYHRGIRAFIYKHAPDECDLRRSSRIFAPYFRWFKLDSV